MATTKKLSMATAGAAFISLGRVSTTILLFMAPLASRSQAASFTATTGYGFNTNTDTASGLGASASSSFNAGNASASAYANSDIELGVFASSEGSGLVEPVVSNAGYSLNYSIVNNPNQISLPLTFNFVLTGNINASSQDVPYGTAGASFLYTIASSRPPSNPDGFTSGQVSLLSAGGQIFPSSNGFIGESSIRAVVTPELGLDIREAFGLEDEDLPRILEEFEPSFPLGSFEQAEFELRLSEKEANLLSLLTTFGSIPVRGTPIEIGFDSEFFFDTPIPVQAEVREGGFINTSLFASSSSSANASAVTDYSNSLSLESITVPADFDAVDISSLSVAFDSGLTIPVTREGVLGPEPIPGAEPQPVPEPSAMLGSLVASAFGAYSLLKRKLKKKFWQ